MRQVPLMGDVDLTGVLQDMHAITAIMMKAFLFIEEV
jgi:hypothetical protein